MYSIQTVMRNTVTLPRNATVRVVQMQMQIVVGPSSLLCVVHSLTHLGSSVGAGLVSSTVSSKLAELFESFEEEKGTSGSK